LEAQRRAARGARGVRGSVQGAWSPRRLLPRAHEEAARVTTAAGRLAYVELTVDAGDEAAEAVTNFLWELGAVGVVEEALADAPARLRAFFPATAAATLLDRVDAYLDGLRTLGFAAGPRATLTPVADADWAAAWREHFRPIPVGRGLLVAPPW